MPRPNRGTISNEAGKVTLFSGRVLRIFLMLFAGLLSGLLSGHMAGAAPYDAYVMDARIGEILFAQNGDTALAPA